MKPEDRIRVQHMIDAANEALLFTNNISEKDFNQNRMLLLSVINEIEILGEAASSSYHY